MPVIEGTFFDGESSKPMPARLVSVGEGAELQYADAVVQIRLEDIKVQARLGNTPRQITWCQQARFVTQDQLGADELSRHLPKQDKLRHVAWLEERMTIALLAVVVTFSAAVGFAVWGVPMIAEAVAFAAPDSISEQLGESTLTTIDQLLSPSELTQTRQQELAGYFAGFGGVQTLEFRKGERIGANAFTLSATTVVMTDELVALADDDDELVAVYLHELGHARLRHVERSILQNSAWVVLFSVIAGDFSGAGELILSLPLALGQMAYSRDFEREADRFAVDAMLTAGLDPNALADILERMVHSEQQDDEMTSTDDTSVQGETAADGADDQADEPEHELAQSVLDYFSTHPATAKRVAFIRAEGTRH